MNKIFFIVLICFLELNIHVHVNCVPMENTKNQPAVQSTTPSQSSKPHTQSMKPSQSMTASQSITSPQSATTSPQSATTAKVVCSTPSKVRGWKCIKTDQTTNCCTTWQNPKQECLLNLGSGCTQWTNQICTIQSQSDEDPDCVL